MLPKTRNYVILGSILVIAAFLAGFLPQFQAKRDLAQQLTARTAEVEQLRWQLQMARARDLAGLVYLEVTKQNYGTANERASALFDQLRSMIESAPDSGTRQRLEEMAGKRDAVTRNIATMDATVAQQIREIVEALHGMAPAAQ